MSEQGSGGDLDNVLTDDDILAFTQRKRKELVNHITSEGMPSDPKDRATLLQALSDMDTTAVNNKKLGAQQKTAEADRVASMAIERFFDSMGNRNPFKGNAEGIDPATVVRSVDENQLPSPDAAPGETDTGISNENYESFMGRFDQQE